MSSGFISETDLAERRKTKNEIWKSTRNENDPEEPPEEAEIMPDNRTLFDRLQEQKNKKQEDWEEAHKLKNMVRGLEDDEVDFLELVDNTKLQQEKRIRLEEVTALKEYRKKVSEMQQKAVESDILAEMKSDSSRKTNHGQGKKSQLSLIAGAIKRKNSESEEPFKKQNTSGSTSSSSSEQVEKSCKTPTETKTIECVAVLPGLGVYTDSSDSEDSDSDIELQAPTPHGMVRDITGRLVRVIGHEKGC